MRTEGKAMVQSALHAGRTAPASRKAGTRRVLQKLLTGASTGAAALIITAIPLSAPAWAQAVNGTPTVVFGANAPVRAAGSDTITVNAHEALVDWTATDSGGVFLPTGNTLNFYADTSVSGAYTVLNRVSTSAAGASPLQINGTVNSGDAGRIWFYNPTGWVVGSAGAFNVGSLLLTASPVTINASNPDGQKFTGANGAITLGQAPNAGASITVQNGARITTVAPGSYVALVAPRVVQGGTVSANGSVAYVGAEAATLTVNNGLFNITVDTDTTDANGVVHTGTTTGAAATFSDPYHGIYLVTVPKNDVTTMLVSGSLGYAPAVAANSEIDGTITLSAGYNVAGGNVNFPATPAASGGRISVSGLTTSNQVFATASDRINVDATASSTNFQSTQLVALRARNAVGLSAAAGHQISTGGILEIDATTGPVGGSATITLTGGGRLAVGSDLNVDVSGNGGIEFDPQNPQQFLAGSTGKDASGGSITTTITNGQLAVTGQALLAANAYGGAGALNFGRSDAGTISFTQSGANSSVAIGPNGDRQWLRLQALGRPDSPSSYYIYTLPVAGAGSSAGNVSLNVADGIFAAGATFLEAGSSTAQGSDNVLYDARTGSVSASFANGSFSLGGLSLSNDASASKSAAVGDVSLMLDAAHLTFDDASNYGLSLYSTAAGTAGAINPQTGQPIGPNTLRLSLTNGSTLDTSQGISLYTSSTSPFAGASRTGDIVVNVSGASTIDSSYFSASARASGTSSAATDAVTGNISITASGGSAIALSSTLSASTEATGAEDLDGAGNGTAGDITLRIEDSSLSADSLSLTSSGYAGYNYGGGARSGLGTGGHVSLSLDGFNPSLTAGSVTLDSLGTAVRNLGFAALSGGTVSAFAASPSSANPHGGEGVGGTTEFTINGGTATIDTLNISANGFGGQGDSYGFTTPVDGGAGTGGTASLTINGGSSSIASLTIEATGRGGAGSYQDSSSDLDAGNGGAGTGGNASLTLNGGSLASNAVVLRAEGNTDYFDGYSTQSYGQGGTVDTAPGKGGTGGTGTGGTASLLVNGGDLIDLPDDPASPTNLAVTLSATGQGGQGGNIYQYGSGGSSANADLFTGDGGAAQGGTAQLTITSGKFDATRTLLDSSGRGGLPGDFSSSYYGSGGSGGSGGIPGGGGRGGDGVGGTATFTIANDFKGTTESGTVQSIEVYADGYGESGASAFTGGAGGGAGGAGTGGTARIEVNAGTVTLRSPRLSATGFGGDGGNSSKGYDGGTGGDATGGRAELVINTDGTSTSVANLSANVQASAGYGGRGGNGDAAAATIVAGNGGAGGSATGGSISIEAGTLSSLTLTSGEGSYALLSNAYGGQGGDGGNSAVFNADSVGNGGKGGDATGGSLDISASAGGHINLNFADFESSGFGGSGGGALFIDNNFGRGPSIGGAGGAGKGGTISLQAADEGSLIRSDRIILTADGEGGNGGSSQGNDLTTGAGVKGANGGSATGGSILIGAVDSGTIDFAEETRATFQANAISGIGSAGTSGLNGTGGAGGRGGDGGEAYGGSISITGNTGGTLHLGLYGQTDFIATGFGSGGGNGGNGADNSAIGGRGGDGGEGGTGYAGVGGNVDITIAGTTLDFGDISFDLTGTTRWLGFGGSPGAGGPGSNPPPPAQPIPPGASGINPGSSNVAPTGGHVHIAAGQDSQGNFSTFSAGNTTIDVTSALVQDNSSFLFNYSAGGVSIENHGGAETGDMTFDSLTVNASGYGTSYYPQVSFISDGGRLGVAQDLLINSVGSVDFRVANNGLIDTNGLLDITTQGDVTFTAENGGLVRAGDVSLYRSGFNYGGLNVYSFGCEAVTCTVLQATGSIFASNFSNMYVSDHAGIDAGTSIDIYAIGGIGGGTGSAYTAGGAISLTSLGDIFVRNASGQSVTVNAGTPYNRPNPADVILGEEDGGGSIVASDFVDIRAGRDIRMPAGNSISAGSTIYMGSGADIRIDENNSLLANIGTSGQKRQAGGALRGLVSGTPGITLSAGTNFPPPTNPPSVPATTLFVGAGTSVDAGSGDVRLEGQTIDARGASFFGGNFSADVLSPSALASAPEPGACATGSICLGDVNVANAIAIGLGEGGAPLGFLGEGTLNGSTLDIRTSGTLAFDGGSADIADTIDLQSTGAGIVLTGANLTAGSLNLSGATDLSGNGIARATAGDIGLGFGGNISAGSLIATGTLTGYHAAPTARFVTPGAFTVLDTLSIAGNAAITASGPIAIGSTALSSGDVDLLSSGSVRLGATSGVRNITISGAALNLGTISGTGAVNLTATGGLTGASISAGTTLVGTAHDLDVTSLSAGGSLTLAVVNTAKIGSATSGGNILIDPISLTFGTMQATGSITLIGGDISGGIIDAGTALDVTAQGLIAVSQRAVGQTITFRSADLDLGTQGVLGTAARTTAITLINSGQSGMLLGDGLTGQTGYRLSNAEFGNIHSGGDLTINAGPSLQVGTLTGTAGSTVAANGVSTDGQIGATGTLRLITAGTASFGGGVTMNGMAGNTLAIDASGGTFIDAATGSIRLLEGQGRGGTLSVSGAGLVAATTTAFTAIGSLSDLGAISKRLDANDGVTAGRTVIEAGALDVGVGQRFLVQNTATGTAYGDRRGLVVDTLTIRAGGAQAPTQIAINGIVGGQTGLAAIPLISVNGAFAAGSTVNGCLLADAASCDTTPKRVDDGDVRNVIVNYLDPPPGTNTVPTADSFTQSPLVQINEITPPGFAPLIDEPVTGTGNDDLLGDGQCRDEGGNCARP